MADSLRTAGKSVIALMAGMVCCLLCSIAGCTATTPTPADIPRLTFYLDPDEGGSLDGGTIATFEAAMAGQGCPLRVTTDHGLDASLHFATRPAANPDWARFLPLLQATTHDNLPLTAAVVVKASTGISSLQNLAGASIGVISDSSYLGFEIPQQMFAAAGVPLDGNKLWKTGSYDSIIVLLLHQDIFAAVLPGPLANRWARANNLSIVAESAPLTIGTLWIDREVAPVLADNCRKVFAGLQRTPFADNPLAVFPRWVEGFR